MLEWVTLVSDDEIDDINNTEGDEGDQKKEKKKSRKDEEEKGLPKLSNVFLTGADNVQSDADMLRFTLLERYGGVWLDASDVLLESLDWVQDVHAETGADYIAYSQPDHTMYESVPVMPIWFEAAVPGSPLVHRIVHDMREVYGHKHWDKTRARDGERYWLPHRLKQIGMNLTMFGRMSNYLWVDVIIQRILQENAGILPSREWSGGADGPINFHAMNAHLGPYKLQQAVGYGENIAMLLTDIDRAEECLSLLTSDVHFIKFRGKERDALLRRGVKRGSCLSSILGDVEIPSENEACTSFACRNNPKSSNSTGGVAATGLSSAVRRVEDVAAEAASEGGGSDTATTTAKLTCPTTTPTTRIFFACHHKTGTILLEHALEVLHDHALVGLPARNVGELVSYEPASRDDGGEEKQKQARVEIDPHKDGARWKNGEGGVSRMNSRAYLYQDNKWQARHAPSPCEETILPANCGLQAELWWHWGADLGIVKDTEKSFDELYDSPTEKEASMFASCNERYRVVHFQRAPIDMVLSHIRYIHGDMEPNWMDLPVDLSEPRNARREKDPNNPEARPFQQIVEEASLDDKVALVVNVTMPSILSMVRASVLADKDPEHQINVRLEDSVEHFNSTWKRVVRFVNTKDAAAATAIAQRARSSWAATETDDGNNDDDGVEEDENEAEVDKWVELLTRVDENSANYAFDFSHQTFDDNEDPELEMRLCESMLRQFPELLKMEAALGYPPRNCSKP